MPPIKPYAWFELPWPPSLNHYWRHVGSRTLLSREGREYRQKALALRLRLRFDTLLDPIALHVAAFPPDRRKRDLDNLLKALLDALEYAGFFEDDAQIEKLVIERREIFTGGRVWVYVDSLVGGKH